MADLLTTLHPINDNNTNLYPNVKRDNLPQNVKDELNAIPNKVDKEQGKGLSTNDFTNADKALVDTIPDKVDKVNGKGLSTNDFTNEDKALVDTIPDKVDKVTGKGLSTNDYTNADKNAVEVAIPLKLSFLNTNILDLYRMVIRSGGTITVTDASVALASQSFPSTVLPKALLNHVGGMCQKVNQLCNLSEVPSSFVSYDITFTNNLDGSITANGTASGNAYINIGATRTDLNGKKVLIFGCPSSGSDSNYFIRDGYNTGNNDIGNGVIVTAGANFIVQVIVRTGYTASNVKFKPRSAIISDIWPTDTPTSTSDARIQWLMSYLSSHPEYDAGSILTAPVTTVVSKGSTNIYYPIHRNIRTLDGYGWGINADCYNYIDFAEKKYVKKVVRVDLSSFSWQGSSGTYYIGGASLWGQSNTELLSPLYTVKVNGNEPGDNTMKVANGNLIIYSNTTPTGYLYYKTVTPVETDISDLLVLTFPTYDIINVLPGGYLEFENENNIGVPYSVTYQSKPDAQTTVQTIAPTAISEVDSNDPTDTL